MFNKAAADIAVNWIVIIVGSLLLTACASYLKLEPHVVQVRCTQH